MQRPRMSDRLVATSRRVAPAGRRASGFTLLELMTVLVIIAVLGAIVGFNLIGAADNAKKQATEASMKTIKAALTQYRVQYNSYPPTGTGLQTLVQERMLSDTPKDGWGRDFEYYSPTQRFPNGFELISAGVDQQFSTPDDLLAEPDPQ